MGNYICELCGSSVQGKHIKLHDALDEWIMKIIIREHPKWKKVDGACPKCIQELKKKYKELEQVKFLRVK